MQYSASAYYYNTDGPYFGNQRRLDKPNTSPNNVPYYYESKACGGQCQPNANSVGYYWSNRYNIADVDTYNITGKFSYKDFVLNLLITNTLSAQEISKTEQGVLIIKTKDYIQINLIQEITLGVWEWLMALYRKEVNLEPIGTLGTIQYIPHIFGL